MSSLKHKHLMRLELEVNFKEMQTIGQTPSGFRRIAQVTAGKFEGERIKGSVLSGADWVINRSDGVMLIDVRLALKTEDSALIYLQYQGRFLAQAEAMARFSKGELLRQDEYSLTMSAKFEAGAEPYRWLNHVVAVGTGIQTRLGPIYEIYEIG